MDISKRDWALFRERLPGWQESYMEVLAREYTDILCDTSLPASERFWRVAERIKADQHHPGVCLRLTKSNMDYDLAALLRENVISTTALDGFSEELKERVCYLA